MKWYVEVYGPIDFLVPDYLDPAPRPGNLAYDSTELEARFERLEAYLKQTINLPTSGSNQDEVAVTKVEVSTALEEPGFTTIRPLTYKDQKFEVPYILRNAFLMPQGFGKSETLLIRLGMVKQARITRELPNDF